METEKILNNCSVIYSCQNMEVTCLSVNDWIKVCVEHFIKAIKKNEILPLATI